MFRITLNAVVSLIALLLAPAAGASVVRDWNAAALAEVRLARFGPPVVARALAVAHTCMYDAWTAYDARAIGVVVGGSLRRPAAERTDANKAKAVSFAAYRCILNLFPGSAARLNAAMLARGYDPLDTSTNLATPQGIGNFAAQAVIDSRLNDGSNQYGTLAPGAYADYTGYAPVNAPMPFCLPTTTAPCPPNTANIYRWQPLISDSGSTQRFIAPHWEQVRPFALSSATQFDAFAPLPNFLVSAANYLADVNQLVAISGALTEAQKLIVEYWADGPESELPPGHWGLFAQFVSQRDNHTIDQDVKMFFAMHNASFDAGIVAWHLKRKYDGVRPITMVRNLKQGQQIFAWGGPGQPNKMIAGEKWTPYNPGSNLTPAFPGYISGHSTFSAASAEVLRSFKGSDHFGFYTVIPPDFGRVEPGVPAVPTSISYATFSAAAAEAGASRLLGGIHPSDDNTVGQDLGKRVGQQAWTKATFLFDGGLAVDNNSSTQGDKAASLTFSHTVSARSNRLLLVGVSYRDGNQPLVGVTYGSRSLTRLGAQNAPGNGNRVEVWYLVAPPAGTANVRVTLENGRDVVAGALSLTGVDQAAPFVAQASAADKTSSVCVTLPSAPAAPAALAALFVSANGDADAIYPAPSHIVGWVRKTGTAGGDIQSTGVTTPAPSGALCQTLQTPKPWSTLAVRLRPAVAH